MASDIAQTKNRSTEQELKNWITTLTDDVSADIKKDREEEIANGLELTDKEKDYLVRYAKNTKVGFFTGVSFKCPGANVCKMSADCPLALLEKEPLGEACPIEKELLTSNTISYVEEYKIDPLKDFGKYSLIMSLARYDIYIRRISYYLGDASTGEVMKEYIIGVDQEGQPISTIDVNRAFNALKEFENQRLRIIKELVGTNKEQYKRDAVMKIASRDPGAAAYLNKVKQIAEDLYSGLEGNKGETIIDMPSGT